MSGLKTAIVSYCLSPGGHCGSSFSSTAVNPGPGEIGSSSDPNPPPKNEPEKSRVWALTETKEWFLLLWQEFDIESVNGGLRVQGNAGIGEERKLEQQCGVKREEVEEDAIEWWHRVSFTRSPQTYRWDTDKGNYARNLELGAFVNEMGFFGCKFKFGVITL